MTATTSAFGRVLRDIIDVRRDEDDRLADLRQQYQEHRAAVQKAVTRLLYADLDKDMRHWTESERDELTSAQEAYDEALTAQRQFEADNAADITTIRKLK